jgi:hypothetical protein
VFTLLFALLQAPLPPSCGSFISSEYISSTIGFHSLTLALMNQLETCMPVHAPRTR